MAPYGDPLSTVSLFKATNQIYQKNFQSYTTLPNVRPMSASTYMPQRSYDVIPTLQTNLQPNMQSTMSRARPVSAYTNLTKLTKASRPMSAQTRKSVCGVKRQGRGLGFFGDDNDKIREHD